MLRHCKIKIMRGAERFLRHTPFRRLVRNQDGVAAVEFGLVAAPFLALLFAISELGLVFFAGQTLETATADASRLILTGQAVGFDATQFKGEVCKRLYAMFGNPSSCTSKLMVQVQNLQKTFGDLPPKPKPDPVTGKYPDDAYDGGGPGCVIVVRVMYVWPVYATMFFNISDVAPGKRLLMATAAFRNEPYGAAAC